jgi:hypothetical protein
MQAYIISRCKICGCWNPCPKSPRMCSAWEIMLLAFDIMSNTTSKNACVLCAETSTILCFRCVSLCEISCGDENHKLRICWCGKKGCVQQKQGTSPHGLGYVYDSHLAVRIYGKCFQEHVTRKPFGIVVICASAKAIWRIKPPAGWDTSCSERSYRRIRWFQQVRHPLGIHAKPNSTRVHALYVVLWVVFVWAYTQINKNLKPYMHPYAFTLSAHTYRCAA